MVSTDPPKLPSFTPETVPTDLRRKIIKLSPLPCKTAKLTISTWGFEKISTITPFLVRSSKGCALRSTLPAVPYVTCKVKQWLREEKGNLTFLPRLVNNCTRKATLGIRYKHRSAYRISFLWKNIELESTNTCVA